MEGCCSGLGGWRVQPLSSILRGERRACLGWMYVSVGLLGGCSLATGAI
jgi:hypothetical protein